MRTRNTVVVGVVGLLVVLAAAAVAPEFVGGLLITFGLVAFVWAVMGFLNPAWGRIPNRMAAVWVFALGLGLFMAGGALVAPPEETVRSSDAPPGTAEDWQAELAARQAAIDRTRASAGPQAVETLEVRRGTSHVGVCLDAGQYVIETEATNPDAAATASLTTLDEDHVAAAMRYRGQPRRVRSDPFVLEDDGCFDLMAQTGVDGSRAVARVLEMPPPRRTVGR